MPKIPRIKTPDSTLAFLFNPYRYIKQQAHNHNSKILEGRLLLRPTIFMKGAENARLFYDASRFHRKDAMPSMVLNTLLGQDGVQTLSDEEHLHRKQMFMSLMTAESISRLVDITKANLQTYAQKWQDMEQVVFYDELRQILTRSVCTWAGVPLPESDVQRRTSQLTALYDSAGAKNHRHLWSRMARYLSDRWAKKIVEDIRANPACMPEDAPARMIALHRDTNNEWLESKVAAVELVNILRPTVAVSVYITFVAHALHQHPDLVEMIAPNDKEFITRFVQEVRRMYPFFPAVAARVREDFEHDGCPFHKGTRVILDLYGTNHDEETWPDPHEFNPDRFLEWEEDLFSLIPQGGGDTYVTHRCPGEEITVELMKAAAQFLVQDVQYDLPDQDLRIDYVRLPALPRSRFIMTNVRIRSPQG